MNQRWKQIKTLRNLRSRKCLDSFFFLLDIFGTHNFNALVKNNLKTHIFFSLELLWTQFFMFHKWWNLYGENWLDCGNNIFVVFSEKSKVSEQFYLFLKACRLEHGLNYLLDEFYISVWYSSFKKTFQEAKHFFICNSE